MLQTTHPNLKRRWFEFKGNWFQPEALGEYVSALSNAAAFHYKKYAYFIWGVEDENHKIVGTTFNQYCDYNKEPYQNYLARNLSPSLNFSFEETWIQQKRVVVLVIPAAFEIPTFHKLFGYYGSKGIVLSDKTFIKNLGLRNEEGQFNLLAQLLSDDSHFPLRVSIFEGKTKGTNNHQCCPA